jgi:hypothetical protein
MGWPLWFTETGLGAALGVVWCGWCGKLLSPLCGLPRWVYVDLLTDRLRPWCLNDPLAEHCGLSGGSDVGVLAVTLPTAPPVDLFGFSGGCELSGEALGFGAAALAVWLGFPQMARPN